MANHQITQADFLQSSRILIENAATAPELAAPLAGYGYDAAKLREGMTLWSQADSLAKKQVLDYGESHGVGQDFEKCRTAANIAYMKTLKVARVAFGDDTRAITALKLYGPRKQSIAGWLEQVGAFYSNLQSEPKLADRLLPFGYTRDKLKAESQSVEDLQQRSLAKVKGSGAAQSATAARDSKLRELDSWVGNLRAIARVAFYENPQELEKLGMMALNSPRRGKKAELPKPLPSGK